jgi:hypothetical protein
LLLATIGWFVATRNWFDLPARWMPEALPFNPMPMNGR